MGAFRVESFCEVAMEPAYDRQGGAGRSGPHWVLRVVRLGRCCSGDLFLLERFDERGFVDEGTAGGVDGESGVLRCCEAVGADGLGAGRSRMQGEVVGCGDHRVNVGEIDALGRLGVGMRRADDDMHVQCRTDRRDRLAAGPIADDAESCSPQLDTGSVWPPTCPDASDDVA